MTDPGSELDEPHFPPVTSIILNWAEQTPDQIAVRQGEHSWTYRELSELAGQLARLLDAHGIEPGDVIAIQGPRSFGAIVSALGVLLSGGVLMLVDRDLPVRRKALMFQEAEPKAIISVGPDPQECDWCGTRTSIHRFALEAATGQGVGFDDLSRLPAKPFPPLSRDAPAYLFFTSGTTGVPKGIVGCHKGLAHFLHWQRTEFAIGPNDRVAQLTSLSFDVVLRDIFLPLTCGGTICLPETADSADAARVLSWLRQERITVLHAVPSLAGFWLDHSATDIALPELRYVFFAGEPLTDVLVGRWRHAVSNECTFINLYGPTETTLAKCYYRVPSIPLPGVQPGGQALPQTQALVLAGQNRLCGVGEAGEIVLRTPFRTLGYLRPTDRMGFVRNPFREDETDWLYFTGDRGRFRPDGTLEILGRLDDQIKIHGVRVEPAEVAAILSGHPAVRTCVVLPLVRENVHLAVYVVLKEQARVSIAQLRSYLAERFPITIGAVALTLLDKIPLTSNGKVDRTALPVPEFDRLKLAGADIAPRTPIEERLAGIWCDVLGREQVGIHDSFFELGGHSLLATKLVSQVRRELKLELPVRSIFDMPTIERLAFYLLEQQSKESGPRGIEELLAELESITEESAERQLLADEAAPDAS